MGSDGQKAKKRCQYDQGQSDKRMARIKPLLFMYLDGSWYELRARPELYQGKDLVDSLDASVLQQNVLAPVLGIEDPRTDERIDFVGGIRGLGELADRVDAGEAVAFALYPTTMDELLDIADAELIMPPKSTWFEPKLRSGLFVHKLSDE